MKITTYLFIIVLILPIFLFAQEKPNNNMKFGDVPIQEFNIISTNLDSTANAIILGDLHQYDMSFIPGSGLSSIHVFRRIKILNEDGAKKLATLNIKLKRCQKGLNTIHKFKACTYNLKNGKISKTKVNQKENVTQNNNQFEIVSYKFQNIKAGSIIEYEYTINNVQFDFPKYYPQQEYPVLYSELNLTYINSIQYNCFVFGDTPAYIKDKKSDQWKTYEIWIFKDVAPLKQDVFMIPVKNYLTSIDYDIEKIKMPGAYYEDYSTSWQKVANDYLSSNQKGNILNKNKFFRSITDHFKLISKNIDSIDLVKKIIHFTRENYKWNGENSSIPTDNFKEVITSQTGNSADMNMLLIGSLNNIGIKAKPVLLSTWDNGFTLKQKPSIDDMNYLISSFEINNQKYFVDAASSFTSINQLPQKCYNKDALVLDKAHSYWTTLISDLKFEKLIFINISFDSNVHMRGEVQINNSGYAAQEEKIKIEKNNSTQDYLLKNLIFKNDISITDFNIINEKNDEQPIKINYTFESEGNYLLEDSLLVYLPMNEEFPNNPFYSESRIFPIDFKYPISLKNIIVINIPSGYSIKESPKPLSIKNNDNTLEYVYNSIQNGQNITIISNLEIKMNEFSISSYNEIKSFFEIFINQQKSPILLVKE